MGPRPKRSEGYRAFKLKVGFGRERDLTNLKALRSVISVDLEHSVAAHRS